MTNDEMINNLQENVRYIARNFCLTEKRIQELCSFSLPDQFYILYKLAEIMKNIAKIQAETHELFSISFMLNVIWKKIIIY